MKREVWQKVYEPTGDMLDIRVRNALRALDDGTERRTSMKKVLAVALVAVLALASAVALAAGLMVSNRVDASALADRALEDKYGITEEMLTYFHRDVQELSDGTTIVTYAGIENFAYVLGTYTVEVRGGEAEVVWSREGEDTSGGFDATAWGAEQLETAIAINKETNSLGEAAVKASEHAHAAGAEWQAPAPLENAVPEGYQSWEHYYRTQALPVMAIAPKDALMLAKDAIVQRYGLSQTQADAMQWHDTWTDFSMVGEVPVLDVWFSLTLEDGTWTEGDGLYGASVNVENGVIEEMYYDSALAGNG